MNNPKLDLNKPLYIRDGRKVRLLCTDKRPHRDQNPYPLVGLVEEPDGGESLVGWTAKGRFNNSGTEHPYDLVNAPEELSITGFFNVYPDQLACFYKDRETADRVASNNRVACVPVEMRVLKGTGL